MKIEHEYSCKEAARLLSKRRDSGLLADEQQRLEAHLALCVNCRNFDQQIDVLLALAKQFAKHTDSK